MQIKAGSYPWPHFSKKEMACPCCGKCDMSPQFMDELELYRVALNHPLNPTSGMRCEKHNATLLHASPRSLHLNGCAVDLLWIPDRYKMLQLAFRHFRGIGISKYFLHLDIGETSKVWFY